MEPLQEMTGVQGSIVGMVAIGEYLFTTSTDGALVVCNYLEPILSSSFTKRVDDKYDSLISYDLTSRRHKSLSKKQRKTLLFNQPPSPSTPSTPSPTSSPANTPPSSRTALYHSSSLDHQSTSATSYSSPSCILSHSTPIMPGDLHSIEEQCKSVSNNNNNTDAEISFSVSTTFVDIQIRIDEAESGVSSKEAESQIHLTSEENVVTIDSQVEHVHDDHPHSDLLNVCDDADGKRTSLQSLQLPNPQDLGPAPLAPGVSPPIDPPQSPIELRKEITPRSAKRKSLQEKPTVKKEKVNNNNSSNSSGGGNETSVTLEDGMKLKKKSKFWLFGKKTKPEKDDFLYY